MWGRVECGGASIPHEPIAVAPAIALAAAQIVASRNDRHQVGIVSGPDRDHAVDERTLYNFRDVHAAPDALSFI
jgi:hypothetical protein